MSRLQSIENALRNINETVFQELCDSYLAIKNENYAAYSRTGSLSGKQKTTKGTPDSFLLLPSGKYIFVECSTNITSKAKKLEEDINKCLDSKKTGIPKEQIAEIILCLNFNLKTKEIEQLRLLLANTHIRLTIISLDSLAVELHINHRDLVNLYLGLPLDTGQIVSLSQFIQEYNRTANHIATPLDNIFSHREKEMAVLNNAILTSDFIILTGSPGVGKTKLAVETIKAFLVEHADYQAYCISYKNYVLLDDLYQYINPQKNYILFVDDANRIDTFNQITGFYKAVRFGKLKVIITVRDYAYNEISRLSQQFNPLRIDIPKLTDEAIRDILASESFQIKNPNYQKTIITIANGIPRLAVMAALLAKAHQNLAVLHDVSDLFEKYFSTFIKDQEELDNKFNLQCLGLIGFFYTLPYKDRELITPILNHFEIDYSLFVDTIDHLDKLELVEIQFENVKIPEQNLAIYFFYKCFVKDDLLSFQTLLQYYFQNNKPRFRECVISANNTFGPEKVMNKLKPDIVVYWNSISEDVKKAYSFLDIFWFYLQLETFEFLINIIKNLPNTESTDYIVNYSNNSFSYEKNQIIELIGEYFRYIPTLDDALKLAFRYIEKVPFQLPELIHKIREKLLFDIRDENSGFYRQYLLVSFLISQISINPKLFTTVFFELSKSLLKYRFQHTEGGRNNTFSWYFYQLPPIEEIFNLRGSIFDAVQANFAINNHKAMELLEDYATISPEINKEIMAFDMPYVIDIISRHLTDNSFLHCRYVHKQVRSFKKMGIIDSRLDQLEEHFINPLYEMFLIIDWNRLRDKEMYEYGDHREYEQLKQKQIRNSFIFSHKKDIEKFYQNFVYLKSVAKNEWNYNDTLELIIDENFNNNLDIGFHFYQTIIGNQNKTNYVPRLTFKNLLKRESEVKVIWNLINSNHFQAEMEWKLSFFEHLDPLETTPFFVDNFLKTISEIQQPIMLQLDKMDKYLKADPKLFQKILKIIIIKNEKSIGIRLWMDFFSSHFEQLGTDLHIIEEAYLQQYILQDMFDYELAAFDKILQKDASFLLKFIKFFIARRDFDNNHEHRNFNIIWNAPDIEDVLFDVFELFAQRGTQYFILPLYLNTFFRNLNENHIVRADNFLMKYLKTAYSDPNRINLVVDIVRNTRKELFESVLLTYVSLNSNTEDFDKIYWRGNGGSYSGNVIIGDIEATEWRNILSIVEKSPLGIDLIPIKKYIIDQESFALKRGEYERKRRFLGNDW